MAARLYVADRQETSGAKVFLDTNVLVSGFATRGLCADIIRLVMAEHDLVVGEVVLSALRRILSEKFGVPKHRVYDIDDLLRRYPVEPQSAERPTVEIQDQDDVWILATALSAGADVLVSGDSDLLDIGDQVQQVHIVAPREFWNMLRH